MTHDELIAGFEGGTIAPGAFGHREHLRLAWLYLQRHGRPEAERRLLDGLRALAARGGQPDKFNAAPDPRLGGAHRRRGRRARPGIIRSTTCCSTIPSSCDRRSVREAVQTI